MVWSTGNGVAEGVVAVGVVVVAVVHKALNQSRSYDNQKRNI